MTYTAGIDVGGTKILAAALKKGEEITGRSRIPTGLDGTVSTIEQFGDRVFRALEGAVKKSGLAMKDIRAVGIGCAGQIDTATGDVLDSPNMPWDRIPLRKMVEERFGGAVVIVNDVQAAAWGEYALGAGKSSRNMVCIFAGTGIGSGIVIEGKLYRGAAGCAGEAGHTSYRVNGLLCECGRRGCAEAYGGGVSLERRARRAIRRGAKTMLTEMVRDADRITADIIHRAASKRDALATRLWRDAELAIATVAHNYVNLLCPDTLVLGGGIVEGLPYLRNFVRDYIDRRAVRPAAGAVEIVAPVLGNKSGAAGAANLAFGKHTDSGKF